MTVYLDANLSDSCMRTHLGILDSRGSLDSDESLRALELSEGQLDEPRPFRGRSYSIGGFDFQHDLLPLSTSLSEPEQTVDASAERNVSLLNGMF